MKMTIEERRERLTTAALTVVKREGVAGATTRAIVTEADMPLGAFHYAFDSRDALLGAVIEEVAQLDRLAAEPALDMPRTGPDALSETVRDGMDRFIDLLVSDPYSELAFLELTLHGARQDLDDGVSRDRYSVTYSTPEYLLARSARACGREWTVPLRHVARLLVSVLDGITVAWLADHDTDAARACVAHHADAIARLSRPASGTAAPATRDTPSPSPDQEK